MLRESFLLDRLDHTSWKALEEAGAAVHANEALPDGRVAWRVESFSCTNKSEIEKETYCVCVCETHPAQQASPLRIATLWPAQITEPYLYCFKMFKIRISDIHIFWIILMCSTTFCHIPCGRYHQWSCVDSGWHLTCLTRRRSSGVWRSNGRRESVPQLEEDSELANPS
jgi:hypothetical protein